MGKQGSQNVKFSFGVKDHQVRGWENFSGSDPTIGRRILLASSHGLKNDYSGKLNSLKGVGKKSSRLQRHVQSFAFIFVFIGFVFLLDSVIVWISSSITLQSSSTTRNSGIGKADGTVGYIDKEISPVQMYSRLSNLASNALLQNEFKQEKLDLWKEPYQQASKWKPCADRSLPFDLENPKKSNGYITVSANGGLNQQRVAICNAVAVAYLLNATLVIPRFLYSNVWKDPSQFGDIYQEDYFINVLKNEVNIVKDLPPHLKSLDVEAIGSQLTDADIIKEAKPADYLGIVLPLLRRNEVVHFLGFGNRLGFDPFPFDLQRLRCKCNFHALKFVQKIQKTGALLVKRIRNYNAGKSILEKQLLGDFMPLSPPNNDAPGGPSKYLALHLRFEVDMVAYSLCDFGGGDEEREELQAYREIHFPLLIERLKNLKPVSSVELRKSGRCPLTPEEAALVLAALGFKRETYIYLAGSEIYGGNSRMQPFTNLYPNLVTKEKLLTPCELAPFRNFSSKLAALDFIACATSDVFTMTDSGSQLSSLVSGFRTFYDPGNAPTLRPNKKRLAVILSENRTIEWSNFKYKVGKMIEEAQRVRVRGFGRSIYRQPRCPECMCKLSNAFEEEWKKGVD